MLSKKTDNNMEDEKIKKKRIETLLPMLYDRQIRIYLASEAQSTGWGGQTKIASLSGKSRFLIARGEKELQNPVYRHHLRAYAEKAAVAKKKQTGNPGLLKK